MDLENALEMTWNESIKNYTNFEHEICLEPSPGVATIIPLLTNAGL